MKLSIIVPSIRTANLTKLYWSVLSSLQDNFEFIVISPNDFEEWPNPSPYVKWIKSFRSPNACQQQGLLEATGDYICFAADDGEFLVGELKEAMEKIDDYKTIIVGKYLEGESPKDMDTADYYKFGFHKVYQLNGVPKDAYIFNCGIISRKFILELGGWDCESFEATTCAHADLGLRALKAGAKMILMDEPMFKCSHEPGRTGTHAPVHNAMKRDLKNFRKIYDKSNNRIKVESDWHKTPPIWKERFK